MKQVILKIWEKVKYLDFSLILCYILLGLVGVVMVYSASMVAATKGSLTGGLPIKANHFMTRQLIFFVLGLGIVLFFSLFLNLNAFKRSGTQQFIVLATLALLLITVLVGKEINGSRNWINLGFFSLQSSEFLKLTFIFLTLLIDAYH